MYVILYLQDSPSVSSARGRWQHLSCRAGGVLDTFPALIPSASISNRSPGRSVFLSNHLWKGGEIALMEIALQSPSSCAWNNEQHLLTGLPASALASPHTRHGPILPSSHQGCHAFTPRASLSRGLCTCRFSCPDVLLSPPPLCPVHCRSPLPRLHLLGSRRCARPRYYVPSTPSTVDA